MALSLLLVAGAGASAIAMVIMLAFVRELRLVMLYALSLPVCVLAYLLVFGQTGLGSPDWLNRPLMYITVAPAVVTTVMLLLKGGVQVRNTPLNKWFVANLTHHLTWLFMVGCMLYAAINHSFGAMWLHALGGACGIVVALLERRKFPKPPPATQNN